MTSTDPGNALFNVFCQNEYWAILRWGNMRWLGNERKRGVRVFLFWSFPGDQTSWLTNFQRGNFSEQSILHLTSMEHLSFLYFLYFASCLCFLTPPFSLVWYYVWTQSLSIMQNIRNKVSAHEIVCTASLITQISFAKCPDETVFSLVLHLRTFGWLRRYRGGVCSAERRRLVRQTCVQQLILILGIGIIDTETKLEKKQFAVITPKHIYDQSLLLLIPLQLVFWLCSFPYF